VARILPQDGTTASKKVIYVMPGTAPRTPAIRIQLAGRKFAGMLPTAEAGRKRLQQISVRLRDIRAGRTLDLINRLGKVYIARLGT
jgi:hypothetical protein